MKSLDSCEGCLVVVVVLVVVLVLSLVVFPLVLGNSFASGFSDRVPLACAVAGVGFDTTSLLSTRTLGVLVGR